MATAENGIVMQGRPFQCHRCNDVLGFRVTAGLRTPHVTLLPRQTFKCNRCGWIFKSVAIAFAEQDAAERDKAEKEKKAKEAAAAAALAEQRQALQTTKQEAAKKGKPK